MKVLVVENGTPGGSLLESRLQLLDCEVELAHGATEGLDRAVAGRPDLIVIELSLEHGPASGFDLVFRFKADARTASIPVYIHSAYLATEKEISTAPRLADGFLPMPLSFEDLRQLVAQVRARLDS